MKLRAIDSSKYL